MGKVHFKNLLGHSPNFNYEPTQKLINREQDIKLEQFTEEVDDVVQT